MRRAAVGFALAAIIAWFGYCSWGYFYWAGIDDDLITIWSGETLGRDWWFINYNGERAEMTSSILAALVAKIAYWIAPDATFFLNKIFMFLCAPASLWLLWHYRRFYLPESNAAIVALAVVATAAAMPHLQYWSQTGMEAPLHTLLLTWYAFVLIGYMCTPFTSLRRQLIILQLLLVLVRPEGFWVLGVTLAMLGLVHGREGLSRRHLKVVLIPLAGFALLLTLRYAATGFLLPNAAYAKISFSLTRLENGLQELTTFYSFPTVQLLLAAAVIIGAVLSLRTVIRRQMTRQSIPLLTLTTVVIAQDAFYVIAGGDFGFLLHRLLVPTTLLKCCLLFHLWSCYVPFPVRKSAMISCLVALVMAVDYHGEGMRVARAGDDIRSGTMTNEVARARNFYRKHFNWQFSLVHLNEQLMWLHMMHGRDMLVLYPFIRDELGHYTEKPLRIMLKQGGFFPYYIKKLHPQADIRFFDVSGLVDAKVGLAATRKRQNGVAHTEYFSRILGGRHAISPLARQAAPNMIYVMRVTPEEREALNSMGWEMIYKRPEAWIWIKQKSD